MGSWKAYVEQASFERDSTEKKELDDENVDNDDL